MAILTWRELSKPIKRFSYRATCDLFTPRPASLSALILFVHIIMVFAEWYDGGNGSDEGDGDDGNVLYYSPSSIIPFDECVAETDWAGEVSRMKA